MSPRDRARRRLLALLVAATAIATGPAFATPETTSTAVVARVVEPVDVDGDCHDDVPADPELVRGPPLRLSVLLAVNNNVAPARGGEIAAALRRLYAPTGIDVHVVVRRVRIPGPDVRELIAATRDLVGGTVPRGVDVVHLITAVDLTSQGSAANIGLADCIGGIRHPTRAFSVSEMSEDVRGTSLGPITGSGDEEARSAAHEIGHLLGATHQMASCVEGAPTARPTDSPCTIMFLAAPSSDVFGIAESAVIRGYVRRYAGSSAR